MRSLTQKFHHTYSPSYKEFKGNNHDAIQKSMRDYHVNEKEWADIGQHFTIFPDGELIYQSTSKLLKAVRKLIPDCFVFYLLISSLIICTDKSIFSLSSVSRRSLVEGVKYHAELH